MLNDQFIIHDMQNLYGEQPQPMLVGPEDHCGVLITDEKMFSFVKEGEIFYPVRRCWFWDTAESQNYIEGIQPGEMMMFLGPTTWYMGMSCEIHTSLKWLIEKQIRFIDFVPDNFVAIWTGDRIKKYLAESNTELPDLKFDFRLSKHLSQKIL